MNRDEEKDKADRVAAAKKRFEQLKKQKSKKQPEKKDHKDEVSKPRPESSSAEGTVEVAVARDASIPPEKVSAQRISASSAKPPNFPPSSPTSESVQDIYRKQAQRIDDLEKENKYLQAKCLDFRAKLGKIENEIEDAREAYSDLQVKEAQKNSADVEQLKCEIASLHRQNGQLQSAASRRRQSNSVSSTSDNLIAQLTSKSATIESLELEISGLSAKLRESQGLVDEYCCRVSALESELEYAAHEATSASTELRDIKQSFQETDDVSAGAETRVAQLQAELGTAQWDTERAKKYTLTLEKKVEAMATLHRESEARSAERMAEARRLEREVQALRAHVTVLDNENARIREKTWPRKKLEAEGEDSGIDELKEEERKRLQACVRELEDEVFELKRGVWRQKRMDMQPGIGSMDADAADFDDIDLSPGGIVGKEIVARAGRRTGNSSLQDVISSGISAFTGASRMRVASNSQVLALRPRKQSLGLLSDDMEFDENAFRRAQEEEDRKRLERVKDVKRGLKEWTNWRLDMADMRAAMGGVFDI